MAKFTLRFNEDPAGSVGERTVTGKAMTFDAHAAYVYTENGDKVAIVPMDRLIVAERSAE